MELRQSPFQTEDGSIPEIRRKRSNTCGSKMSKIQHVSSLL